MRFPHAWRSPDEIERGEDLRGDEVAWHEATLVVGGSFKDIDGKFRRG
jgi:hypothetical protein